MGRQSCDVTVIPPSIALLQERFRQLRRAKEMREARELLRLLSKPERVNAATQYKATRWFHSELIHSPSNLPQCSLNILQSDFQNKHTDPKATEIQFLTNLRSTDRVVDRTTNFDDSDVDTSLHL